MRVNKDAIAKNNQNEIFSLFGFTSTCLNVGIPPIKYTVNPIVKFNMGNFVNIQTIKLNKSKIEQIISVVPKIFFDLFTASNNMSTQPVKHNPANKITVKLFFNATTLYFSVISISVNPPRVVFL
jgi:hypothetical protein